MKIIHPSGKAYHLSPDTQLEIERPNLFFNDYGEQSLPVDLPDSEHNRALMGYPDQLANRKKPSADIFCTLQDGDYSVQARQAILGAKRNEHISTSFYLNDGAFLSKLNNVSLKEVFGDECIPGVNTIEEGISFCRGLITNSHPDFAIFPLLVNDETTDEDGNAVLKCLNLYGYTDSNGSFCAGVSDSYLSDFYNAIARTITEDDNQVSVGAGYYMTPFIRANYVLKRILEYFGYTLLDNFFTTTPPFNGMVFVNTTADSLINGRIRLTDLLPDVSCNDILEYYRNSFCCEFISDEVAKTVTIELFNDILSAGASTDLTLYKAGETEISYPEEYKQLCLKYSEKLSDDMSIEGEKTLAELGEKYPVLYEHVAGGYFCSGFVYTYNTIGGPSVQAAYKTVSPASMPYQEHNDMPVETKEIPAMLPEERLTAGYKGYGTYRYLFAGDIRWKNSALVLATSTNEDADAVVVSGNSDTNKSMPIMPAFTYYRNRLSYGLVNNYLRHDGSMYDSYDLFWPDLFSATKLWDYSLCPTGADGLFEKFYRNYDNLLRNSLHTISVPLLLPDELKSSLSAHRLVSYENQKMFVSKLRYTLGDKSDPVETELLTSRLYEPISIGQPLSRYQHPSDYYWTGHCQLEESTESEYESSDEKTSGYGFRLAPFYPIPPLAEYVGKKFYQRTIVNRYAGMQGHYYVKLTYWLECVKNES